jgi:ABC-2 type transport system permease protein
MSGFWKFTEMNFRMFYRDYQMVFWSIMFPVILMTLLGVAFGAIGEITFKIAVIDEDESISSELFIDTLKDVEALEVSTHSEISDARTEMKNGNMDLIIIIPDGFEMALLKTINLTNISSDMLPIALSEFPLENLANFTMRANISNAGPINITVLYNDANQEKSFSALAIIEKVSSNVNKQLTGTKDIIVIVPEKSTGGDFEFIDYIAPGILAMSIMQTGIFGMSLFIVSSREKGILKRLQATPVSPGYILTSRILVSLVVVGIQTVILLGIAVFMFNVQIVGNLLLLTSMIIMGSIVFIMLGFIISSVSKTTSSAESLSNVISLPMMFLGDVFIPISILPGYIQVISRAMPLTYLSDTFRKIMLHGSGIEDIWMNILILVIFGIIMFVGAVKMFRWEK